MLRMSSKPPPLLKSLFLVFRLLVNEGGKHALDSGERTKDDSVLQIVRNDEIACMS